MTTFEETKDLEKSVDSESFIEADMKSSQSQKTEGVAVMKKLHYAEDSSEIPEEYKGLIFPRDNTEFYIFECEDIRSEEKMVLVARQGEYHDELELIKEWIGVDSLSRLAGKSVPIQDTEHEFMYKFPQFGFDFIDSDMESVKNAYESGWIEYKDGQWVKSEKIKQYDKYMDMRTDQIGSTFWIVLASSFFAPVGWMGTVLLMMAISLFIGQSYLNSRDEPIEFVADRI